MGSVEFRDLELFDADASLEWSGFTDRVMGGSSDMDDLEILEEGGRRFLRIAGRVRLENGGGFIQARADFPSLRLDASGWKGLEIVARAEEGRYQVHLRTPRCVLPWSFYGAPLVPAPGWGELRVPFDVFSGAAVPPGPFETGSILSLGLLAAGEAFEARLDVARISLFR